MIPNEGTMASENFYSEKLKGINTDSIFIIAERHKEEMSCVHISFIKGKKIRQVLDLSSNWISPPSPAEQRVQPELII